MPLLTFAETEHKRGPGSDGRATGKRDQADIFQSKARVSCPSNKDQCSQNLIGRVYIFFVLFGLEILVRA